MKYYIIEHQIRDDGEVNVIPEVSRSTLQMAKSYYHDRYSKMSATTLYPSVSIMLVDEDLRCIDSDIVETMWVPPAPEPEPTPGEQPVQTPDEPIVEPDQPSTEESEL